MTTEGTELPIVAAVALRRTDGRVLLVRHTDTAHPGAAEGRWTLPAEPVADDEVVETALARLLEQRLHLASDQVEFSESVGLPGAIANVFACAQWTGDPAYSADDYADAAWAAPHAPGAVDLVEGVRYVIAERTLGLLLLAGMVGALLALPYQIMLPGFVRDVLGGGPIELGLLIAVSAVGSLAGSLVLASLPARRRGLLLLLSSLFVGVALIGFASTRLIWLSGFFMLFVGIGSAGRQALGNVLLQHYSLDEYRGRVMSLYMIEFGIMSFGAVLFGLFAEQVGGQWAFGTVSAVLVVLTLAMIAFLPRLRRLD